MPRFNPGDHPRYPNGRFRPKVTQSVRLSTHSISYNAGVRIPIIPGRANIYAGALFRLERQGGGQLFKKQTDALVDKGFALAGKDSNGVIGTLLKDREITLANGTRIQAPKNLINTNPSFRVSKSSGGETRKPKVNNAGVAASSRSSGGKIGSANLAQSAVRAPNRKPRKALVNGRRVR